MYKKILIATDGSKLADKAVDHGIALARSVGAEAVFVTVTESWSVAAMAHEVERGHRDAIEAFENAAALGARKILENAKSKALTENVSSTIQHIQDQSAAEGILDVAQSKGCDLIVMASHGWRGLKKLMLGSQTSEVLSISKCPVLVLR